jgi:hypothetical protein
MEPEIAYFGLARRCLCWRLTWRGRLLVVFAVMALGWGVLLTIHPFLATIAPVPANIMVLEGWAPANIAQQAAAEYRRGHYHHLLMLRPIVDDTDKYSSGRYFGDYVAHLLVQFGVPKEEEVSLFPIIAQKDRTYHSALAAKQWMLEQGFKDDSLDLVTVGPHARRSRLMYEKAFGKNFKIGIVALVPREYDPAHWWRTSEGVREVIGETIAYLYARLVFYPPI